MGPERDCVKRDPGVGVLLECDTVEQTSMGGVSLLIDPIGQTNLADVSFVTVILMDKPTWQTVPLLTVIL